MYELFIDTPACRYSTFVTLEIMLWWISLSESKKLNLQRYRLWRVRCSRSVMMVGAPLAPSPLYITSNSLLQADSASWPSHHHTHMMSTYSKAEGPDPRWELQLQVYRDHRKSLGLSCVPPEPWLLLFSHIYCKDTGYVCLIHKKTMLRERLHGRCGNHQ